MLLLASASPARRALLRQAGVRFEVVPSNVPEIKGRGRTLDQTVLENARRKARAVARRFPDRWVLAADTLVEYEGRIYGKPKDRKTAVAVLSRLAGRTHNLSTGVVLQRGRRVISRIDRTRVTLRALSPGKIGRILKNPEKLAGGYAIRKGRDPLVASIRGSFSNVVGLPMEVVMPLLKQLRLARYCRCGKHRTQ
jgi:septum formation protein